MKEFYNQQKFINQIRRYLFVLILGIPLSGFAQPATIKGPVLPDGYFCPDEFYDYEVDIPSSKTVLKIEWKLENDFKDIANFYTQSGDTKIGKTYTGVKNVKVKFENDPSHSLISGYVTVYYDGDTKDVSSIPLLQNRRALEKPTISAPIVYCGYTSNITITAAFSDPLTPSDVDLYEWKIPSGWSGSSTTSWIACTPTANTGGVVQAIPSPSHLMAAVLAM